VPSLMWLELHRKTRFFARSFTGNSSRSEPPSTVRVIRRSNQHALLTVKQIDTGKTYLFTATPEVGFLAARGMMTRSLACAVKSTIE
jgi:hypothetical protein